MKLTQLVIKDWFLKKMDKIDFMAISGAIGCFVDGNGYLDLVLEKETEKAICVSTEWNGYRRKVWFPKSVCEYKF